jgi:hypothetical protein
VVLVADFVEYDFKLRPLTALRRLDGGELPMEEASLNARLRWVGGGDDVKSVCEDVGDSEVVADIREREYNRVCCEVGIARGMCRKREFSKPQ